WLAIRTHESALARQDFDTHAAGYLLALQNGINQYVDDVSALQAALQASEHGLNRREFQSFSDQLLRDHKAIVGVSWIPPVTRGQRRERELEAVRDGVADYRIKSVAADGSVSVAGDADEYFPIHYSSSQDASSSVYGLDLNDGGIRQQTIERARDEDRAAASPNMILRKGGSGFFIMLPVY